MKRRGHGLIEDNRLNPWALLKSVDGESKEGEGIAMNPCTLYIGLLAVSYQLILCVLCAI